MLSELATLLKTLNIQPSKSKTAGDETTAPSTSSSTFDTIMKDALEADSSGKVNEEEVFAALTVERIAELKGSDVASDYSALLARYQQSTKRSDGYIPVEKATLSALKKFVSFGKLTSAEADKIYTDSFAAAQLDDNSSSLYDSVGGGNDPTVAMAKLSVALSSAKTALEDIDTGNLVPVERTIRTARPTGSTSSTTSSSSGAGTGTTSGTGTTGTSDLITPKGTVMDGSEGFLWKPVSNGEGRLAIMLGKEFTHNVASVSIKDAQGNLIEDGNRKSAGISETGREKFTFSKKGGAYPKDVVVEVKLNDGTIKRYSIPDPSKRYD